MAARLGATTPEEKEHKSTIKVIVRMTQLLDALAARSGAVHLKDLSITTGLHPSTAHRILNVLCEQRMVERVDAGSYRLGIRLLELGNLFKQRLSVREEALPYMHQLQHQTSESVVLSIRQKDEVIFVERAVGTQSMMRVVHAYGARALLHVTATGKMFLAEDDEAQWRDYAERTRLHALTAKSIDNFTALEQELREVRRHGYALEDQEEEAGVCGIGASIRNDEGKMVAGLSLLAPSDRMRWSWAGLVKDTADSISRIIGYLPPHVADSSAA
jgi:DNA-binding IclR family transcriptional regulator